MDMKLSDFLVGVGRPVAYYPKLVPLVGTTNATLFFCQFAYWQDKQDDPEGWIYKTAEEIQAETGLTYYEQKNARKHLKEVGFIDEKYARLEHEMYFRIVWNTVNEAWRTHKSSVPQSEDVTLANDASRSSLIGNAESTTENTTHTNPLSEEELRQANAKVTAIIQGSAKQRYPNREKFPEAYHGYCDAYVELTGQQPRKSVLSDWLQEFAEWRSIGLQVKHIKAAIEQSRGRFAVTRPGSLTKTAVAILGEERVKRSSAEPHNSFPTFKDGKVVTDER